MFALHSRGVANADETIAELGIAKKGEILQEGVAITHLPDENKIRVLIDGDLFTEYLSFRSKPILYPVIGPHGVRMTRDYPMKLGTQGEPKDHIHQTSLWFTHGDVNGCNFWGPNQGRAIQTKLLELTSGKEQGVIRTNNDWVAYMGEKRGETVCTDQRRLTFSKLNGGRVIDYKITIIASHGDVTFGDTKEGTMGIRTHTALCLENNPKRGINDARGKAVNSEGDRDGNIWGKKAKWVDYWAPVEGHTVGIAIFNHPKNLIHPTWWHARSYGLIAANPFGVHDFENKPPHTGDATLKAGERRTFKYRFFFHPGDAQEAKIAELYDQYEQVAQ